MTNRPSRLLLPAYGRELLRLRRLGQHPRRVRLIYGADWNDRPPDMPCVCIGEDYESGQVNWTVIAGLPLDIDWRSGARIDTLIAEVMHYAAPVMIHSARLSTPMDAEDWLSGLRWAEDGETRVRALGNLWTPERLAEYRRQRNSWEIALLEDALIREKQKTA